MADDGQRDSSIGDREHVDSMSEEEHYEQSINPLVPILDIKEHFECKITLKCSFNKVVEIITKELGKNPQELAWFKTNSPFGHFLDIPAFYQHSSQVMWLLLLRQVKCERKNEMWFVLNGKPVRFCLLEYVLISGLKSSEFPVDCEKQIKSTRFRRNHFPKHNIITPRDVEKKLVEMGTKNNKKRSRNDNDKINMEKIKMAMLLFASEVLYQADKSTTSVQSFLLGLVDNVDMFLQFPWGRNSFVHITTQLRKSLKQKAQKLLKDGETSSTMYYTGFAYPLAVLVYECVPAIASVYARRHENIP